MSEPQGFPLWDQPWMRPDGRATQAFRQFLLTLWQRSGGSSSVIVDVELLDAIPGSPPIDTAARKMADDAFMMALLAKSAADGAQNASQAVYMPLALGSGQVVIAPDGRLIPTFWGYL